jgi:hypothetical protein
MRCYFRISGAVHRLRLARKMICYRCLHVAEPKAVIKKGLPFLGCQKCEGIIFMIGAYLRVLPVRPV